MGTLGVEGAERCAELARDREDDPLEAPYMGMKGEAMLRTDFSPSFKLWLATKDARLAAEAGAAAGAEIPGIEAIAAQMEAVAAKHPTRTSPPFSSAPARTEPMEPVRIGCSGWSYRD
jgi:3-hydroxyisobutyrate dehydrogenase-like beta-hydroxyacid dehydrogenase